MSKRLARKEKKTKTTPAVAIVNKKDMSPANPLLRSDVLKLLNKSRKKDEGIHISKISDAVGISVGLAKQVLTHLSHHDGYNIISCGDDRWKIVVADLSEQKPLELQRLLGKEYTFGVVTDSHICNVHARLDVLEAAYTHFAQQDIVDVIHAGNIIDGQDKNNQFELLAHGVHDQAQYLADHYPQRDGITTHFLTGECYDDQTEVLTRERGFIRFIELTGLETLATLNLLTQEWEWQKPTHLIRKPYKGDLLHFRSQKVDFMVTPGHRMFFRKNRGSSNIPITFTTAEEFPLRGEKQFFRGCSWKGPMPEKISIPRIRSIHPWSVKNDTSEFPTLPFMRFLGWYIAEGCVDGTGISIGQNPGDNQDEIIDTIKALGFKPRKSGIEICFSSIHLSAYLRKLGKSYEKFIPDDLKQLDQPALREFLQSYWKGDGHKYATSNAYASTTSRQLACDLVEIAMKCGWAAMFTTHGTVGEKKWIQGVETKSNYLENCVYLAKNTMPWFSGTPTPVPYNGEVFCAQVPNGTLLVRRNGRVMWGSNCHEGWYQKREGLKIGWYLQKWAEDCGRQDLKHLGFIERDIVLEQPFGKTLIRVIHPGGGSSYALSYSSQKMVESFQGGDKPHVMIMGHYHKYDCSYAREVFCLQPGCLEDQTTFMRK